MEAAKRIDKSFGVLLLVLNEFSGQIKKACNVKRYKPYK